MAIPRIRWVHPGAGLQAAHEQQAKADEAEPRTDQPADRHPLRQAPGQDRGGHRGDGDDEQPQPGAQRRVVQPALQVEDEVEQDRVQRPVHPERGAMAKEQEINARVCELLGEERSAALTELLRESRAILRKAS
jgi:hypothetical protein